ncbi:Histone acetyltransferase [Pseudomonas syringae pv. actinidiae]|uniref:Histone acetyltransferase n=1 Tax=Pseudomonas syringae pv. actinidiae TaxID=103796 RepID=A0AAN4TJ41_PSESF|nr:Histone acetyltransferase [Pseudomonas syringae pv. actinidiae]
MADTDKGVCQTNVICPPGPFRAFGSLTARAASRLRMASGDSLSASGRCSTTIWQCSSSSSHRCQVGSPQKASQPSNRNNWSRGASSARIDSSVSRVYDGLSRFSSRSSTVKGDTPATALLTIARRSWAVTLGMSR